MTGSDVLHHDDVMADEASTSGNTGHDHTQGARDRELEQAGCRAIMGMGDTIQLLCRDQDVGLHSIGNAALCLRSWCDSMQSFRGDKERAAKEAAHRAEFEGKMARLTGQGGLGKPNA